MDQAGIEDASNGDKIGEELILDVLDDHVTVSPEQDWAPEMPVETEGWAVDILVLWQFRVQSLQDPTRESRPQGSATCGVRSVSRRRLG